ncbi:MAG: hypothetical protein ACE5IE_05725 [Dehalococcoidia bacterium]
MAESHAKDRASRIEHGEIAEVVRLVDESSAKMLWYFWRNRHARLDELKELLGETYHMDVLIRITEIINPAARRVLGKPILVFEKSALDYYAGQHVFHSWWLNEEATSQPGPKETLVYLFPPSDERLYLG